MKATRESKNTTHKVKVNKFSDMTPKEFRTKYGGYKPAKKDTQKAKKIGEFDQAKFESEPRSINWVSKGAVTPIKDQEQCGSCFAFGQMQNIEQEYFLQTGKQIELSVQQLIDCSTDYGNYGCDGGNFAPTFEYSIDYHNESWYVYGYENADKNCRAAEVDATDVQVINYSYYPYQDHYTGHHIQSEVANHPVGAAISIDILQDYDGGIISWNSCSQKLEHIVNIVGYTENAYIMRNSWADDWGEKGYFRLEKNLDRRGGGTCGVRKEVYFAEVRSRSGR